MDVVTVPGVYAHEHTHTCIHTYSQKYIHTHALHLLHVDARIYTIHAYIHDGCCDCAWCICTQTHTYMHTHIHTQIHTYLCTTAFTACVFYQLELDRCCDRAWCICTQTHTYMNTCIHTYMVWFRDCAIYHIWMHAYALLYMHTYINARIYTIPAYTHTYIIVTVRFTTGRENNLYYT